MISHAHACVCVHLYTCAHGCKSQGPIPNGFLLLYTLCFETGSLIKPEFCHLCWAVGHGAPGSFHFQPEIWT